MVVALIVFGIAGFFTDINTGAQSNLMIGQLSQIFNLTPWCLIIPAATVALIVLRLNTALTLAISTVMGIIGIFLFQPSVLSALEATANPTFITHVATIVKLLLTETSLSTGNELLDSLVSTGGMGGNVADHLPDIKRNDIWRRTYGLRHVIHDYPFCHPSSS